MPAQIVAFRDQEAKPLGELAASGRDVDRGRHRGDAPVAASHSTFMGQSLGSAPISSCPGMGRK
jgi:hypothetical protein